MEINTGLRKLLFLVIVVGVVVVLMAGPGRLLIELLHPTLPEVVHLSIVKVVGYAAAVALLGYLGLFVYDYTFTFAKECNEDGKGTDAEAEMMNDLLVRRIIIHGYVFTFLALAFSLLPLAYPPFSTALGDYFRKAPMGFLLACQETQEMVVTRCSDPSGRRNSAQWVYNIGGEVLARPAEARSAGDAGASGAGGSAGAPLSDTEPAGQAPTGGGPATGLAIHGGMVIPMYLIVLSMMGASVGLARRLPEYQKRSSPAYRHRWGLDQQGEPPLLEPEVRELVVFQVMQVVSAPLVAITGYAIIVPGDWAGVVLLGFASGFASEAVLKLIRRGIDNIGGGHGLGSAVTGAGSNGEAGSPAKPAGSKKAASKRRAAAGGAQQP